MNRGKNLLQVKHWSSIIAAVQSTISQHNSSARTAGAVATYLNAKVLMAQQKLSISRLHTVPPAEIGEVVKNTVGETDSDTLDAWISLFRNRALRLIRSGSTTELRDESMILNRNLYSGAGRDLQTRNPTAHARLQMVAEMLGEAAQRSDSVFVLAVLSSHDKYARPMLEMLSRAGTDGVPRQKILNDLRVPSESYLSHILADFEKADLVIKLRRTGTKGVRVAIGSAGRDFVNEKLLPRWFLSVVEMVGKAADDHVAPPPAKVASILETSDSPSKLVADHVVGLLTKITGKRSRGDEAMELPRATAR